MTTPRQTPAECNALLAAGHVYLDVRTEEEFNQGHPAGAYNVPIAFTGNHGMEPNGAFVAVVRAVFPADARLVVGCAAGGRSKQAVAQLEAAGFTALVENCAGFDGARSMVTRQITEPGWRAAGLPVATRAEPGRGYAELESRARSAK